MLPVFVHVPGAGDDAAGAVELTANTETKTATTVTKRTTPTLLGVG
jgi:hypothetical protein